MLLTKSVIQKWNGKTKSYYIEKGYNFTKVKDEFEVKIEDLSPSSHIIVEVICDYCNKEIPNLSFKTYNTQRKKSVIQKDCCKACSKFKIEESNLVNYGVANTMCIEELKEKQQQAIFDKYGVYNVSQVDKFQEKKKITSIEKYGVEHYSKTDEYKTRVEETNLEKYGNIHPMKVPHIVHKGRLTLSKNNTAPTSKQQKHIHSIIGGELNYPVDSVSFDIAFPKEKIYFEYDGGGHNLDVKIGKVTEKDFLAREKRRYFHFLDKGWRCIRLISPNDKLPLDKDIINFVNNSFSDFNENPLLSSIKWYTEDNTIKKSYRKEAVKI